MQAKHFDAQSQEISLDRLIFLTNRYIERQDRRKLDRNQTLKAAEALRTFLERFRKAKH